MQTPDPEKNAFAHYLRQFRTDRNLSQLALSALSGVNINTIWRLENETSSPNTTTLVSLAQALDVSTDILLGLNRLNEVSSVTVENSQSEEVELKLKMEALHRHTAHYTSVYNHAEALIYAMDIEGILVEFNGSFQDLMGYERRSLLGTAGIDLLSPVSLSLSHSMLEKKKQGVIETVYPINFVTKNNGDPSVNVRTQLIFEQGVPIGIQGIGHVVT